MAHKLRVNLAQTLLPNGVTYAANAVVILTDEQFGQIQPIEFTDGALTDLGVVVSLGHSVTAVGTQVDLPNGVTLAAGQTIIISDRVFSQLSPTAISSGSLTDNGPVLADQMGNAPVAKTGAYTLAALDTLVLANATGGAFSVTLPAAPIADSRYAVKKTDASANVVTVLPGTGTIDGAVNATLTTQYSSQDFMFDGANWWKV